MGANPEIRTEDGEVVAEDPGLGKTVAEILGRHGLDDSEYPLLSGIDPYGDTVFNSVQIPRVVRELEQFVRVAPSALQEDVRRLIGFIQPYADRQRWYLWFIGD